MALAQKPFSALTAQELMCQLVVTIPEQSSLAEAAETLMQEHVTGAPVVNLQGRCVGMITSSDFLALWASGSARPEDPVNKHMSKDPVMAGVGTASRNLARMMIDAHIHRIVIVDQDKTPVGIVSSTDILAAVAYGGLHRTA
jgi:predicted transcriptional regulator